MNYQKIKKCLIDDTDKILACTHTVIIDADINYKHILKLLKLLI